MVRTPDGCIVDVCTKLEADSSILSKVIRGSQNFEIGHVTLSHAHLGVDVWSGRSRGVSSISVPNLKRITLFVPKLLGGSQNFDLGQVTLSHAHFGVIL